MQNIEIAKRLRERARVYEETVADTVDAEQSLWSVRQVLLERVAAMDGSDPPPIDLDRPPFTAW